MPGGARPLVPWRCFFLGAFPAAAGPPPPQALLARSAARRRSPPPPPPPPLRHSSWPSARTPTRAFARRASVRRGVRRSLLVFLFLFFGILIKGDVVISRHNDREQSDTFYAAAVGIIACATFAVPPLILFYRWTHADIPKIEAWKSEISSRGKTTAPPMAVPDAPAASPPTSPGSRGGDEHSSSSASRNPRADDSSSGAGRAGTEAVSGAQLRAAVGEAAVPFSDAPSRSNAPAMVADSAAVVLIEEVAAKQQLQPSQ